MSLPEVVACWLTACTRLGANLIRLASKSGEPDSNARVGP
jgi:hypothetical protein